MSLWDWFAENRCRSRYPFHRPTVDGLEGRRHLIRSCLLAVFSGAVFALEASAGFITTPSYPAGPNPVCVAVGDFNRDGIPDLAVANAWDYSLQTGAISILLGKGLNFVTNRTNCHLHRPLVQCSAWQEEGQNYEEAKR